MAAKGYNNYHGRRSTKRVIAVVLLALVLLLSSAYLVLQDYIVYDSQGNATLDLPFFHREDGAQTSGQGEGTQLPVEVLKPDTGSQPDTQRADAPALAVTEQSARGLRSLETLAPDPGATAVVVELKDHDGVFYYQSACANGTSIQEQAVSRSRLADLLPDQRDWTAVAALCCFHDTIYAFSNMEGAGICQDTGYIWYDNQNTHWLDPAKEGTRDYLYAVALECRDMGFDEILLRDFTYPTQGKLEKIGAAVRQADKAEVLVQFLTGMREALGEDTRLSVEVTQSQVLAGADATSGVDLAQIVPLVDHLFVKEVTDRQAVETALAPLLGEDADLDAFLVVE